MTQASHNHRTRFGGTLVPSYHKLRISTFFVYCCTPLCLAASPGDSVQQHIKEVEIKVTRQNSVSETPQGRIYWNMASLEGMPHLLGAADPLRCLQLLPGISTNNDYATGIHVQGCSPAHTLPEIDGAPVFNASHLLGLFSVFTASHFRGMSLTKSRHNASFGNYLGGHLAFHPLDSLARAVHLNATFSFMESEGTLTLPTGRKGTLYLSARGSYLNLLYGDLMDVDEMKMNYGLQDYNLTYIVLPDERNRIQFNVYHGSDHTDMLQKDYQSDCTLNWQNTAASLNWHHLGRKLAMKQTVFFSHYDNETGIEMGGIALEQTSGLVQTGYKSSARHTSERWDWTVGLDYRYTVLRPMEFHTTGSYMQNDHPAIRERAHEASAYAHTEIRLCPQFTLNGGLRLSCYRRGHKTHVHPSPRITALWQPLPCHSFYLHYGTYHQYLHQVTLSNGGLPVDFWTSSSPSVSPEKAHSIAIGYRMESPRKTYEAGVELYYKRLKGQYEYHGSIFDILTASYDMTGSLSEGNGENYGMDVLLKRNRGKLTGWISYSLSRSRRHFPDRGTREWYNSAYERRHDLSLAAEYKITPHWSVGGDFVLASGTPYTAVRSLYMLNLNLVNEYGKHNGNHLPPAHRIDLSLTYRLPKRKKAEHSINLSVFNVYAHRNVLFRYMDFSKEHYGYKPVYSLCRALPSVGYTLKY